MIFKVPYLSTLGNAGSEHEDSKRSGQFWLGRCNLQLKKKKRGKAEKTIKEGRNSQRKASQDAGVSGSKERSMSRRI